MVFSHRDVLHIQRGAGLIIRPVQSISISSRFTTRKDVFSMLNLNSVMIGTTRSKELAAFYEKVFEKPADMVDSDNGFFGWQVGSAYMSVLEHSEMGGNAKDPGRVMFNFETAEVVEEFERIKAVGGVVIRAPY